jgi:hypothetical protein
MRLEGSSTRGKNRMTECGPLVVERVWLDGAPLWRNEEE